jgi:hypothetical protein
MRALACVRTPFPNSVPQGRLNFRPVQIRFEKRLGSATTLYGTVALSFVIPSEAEGSAVPRTSPGSAEYYTQTKLSSRPGRSVVERSAVFFYFSRRFLSPHESVLDSSRSNSSNLIVFGRALLKALNKLPRQKANCSANLDTLEVQPSPFDRVPGRLCGTEFGNRTFQRRG